MVLFFARTLNFTFLSSLERLSSITRVSSFISVIPLPEAAGTTDIHIVGKGVEK